MEGSSPCAAAITPLIIALSPAVADTSPTGLTPFVPSVMVDTPNIGCSMWVSAVGCWRPRPARVNHDTWQAARARFAAARPRSAAAPLGHWSRTGLAPRPTPVGSRHRRGRRALLPYCGRGAMDRPWDLSCTSASSPRPPTRPLCFLSDGPRRRPPLLSFCIASAPYGDLAVARRA